MLESYSYNAQMSCAQTMKTLALTCVLLLTSCHTTGASDEALYAALQVSEGEGGREGGRERERERGRETGVSTYPSPSPPPPCSVPPSLSFLHSLPLYLPNLPFTRTYVRACEKSSRKHVCTGDLSYRTRIATTTTSTIAPNPAGGGRSGGGRRSRAVLRLHDSGSSQHGCQRRCEGICVCVALCACVQTHRPQATCIKYSMRLQIHVMHIWVLVLGVHLVFSIRFD